MSFLRNHLALLAIVASGTLAASAGYFAATALGLGAQAPTTTTTVQVGAGATGPAGPPGPAGPAGPQGPAGAGGADQCPTGSTFKAVVLNQPGGHIELWVCVAN